MRKVKQGLDALHEGAVFVEDAAGGVDPARCLDSVRVGGEPRAILLVGGETGKID